MNPPNLLTEWARLLMASLRAAGVEDVVLSPGSRSTPFTWAALRDPGLRCRTIVDERSAAFFAVGQARMSGRATLLVCTSGSAAANYFPAVVEAAESATPLLLLTADRPFELQHAAAPQTIDQTRLFGDYARRYFELGMPDPEPAMLGALQRMAAQAVLASRAPLPGPVHLNARARKPLEPVVKGLEPAGTGPASGAAGAEAGRLRETVEDLVRRGPSRASATTPIPDAAAVQALAAACRSARRGIIVCGPAAPWQAADAEATAELVRATGFAFVPEAASQQRFPERAENDRHATGDLPRDHVIDAFPTLLASERFRDTREPDLILQIGRPPTASAWDHYLRRWPAERFALWPYGWADPWSSATAVIQGDPTATIRALLTALPGEEDAAGPATGRAAWLDGLRRANDIAWSATDAVLRDGYTEGAAVRAAFDAIPAGGVLALGNSLPIRHGDSFLRAAPRGISVWSQRGANGIDGLVSGAAGAAASGRPTTLLIGDVSFLHDMGGLYAAREAGGPLTIVILNNGGGRIFEQLPIAGTAGAAFSAWLTPPRVDFAAVTAAFGIPHARCESLDALTGALAEGHDGAGGPRVVEAVLPDSATTAPRQEILRRIDARLSSGS